MCPGASYHQPLHKHPLAEKSIKGQFTSTTCKSEYTSDLQGGRGRQREKETKRPRQRELRIIKYGVGEWKDFGGRDSGR